LFRIGILGENPFGDALDQTVQGESVENRKLKVVRSQNLEELKDCQIIFVCKSEDHHMAEILAKLDSRPVLTVSEIDGFARGGGTIRLYLEGNKVRFEVNPDGARRKGLKISSQMLSLGKIVKSEGAP